MTRNNEIEVNGKHYYTRGDRAAVRLLAPNETPDRSVVSAITPHPDPELRAKGYRLAWLFLPLLFVICMACYLVYCLPVSI